ncbi:MAG: trimethylamine methyltransferase [Chloroflexi bacterium B3_Chlor]|nr:MAG: trimethylamine methyltransferase [Chloroflexi bacterium B3_Chlor]
MPRTGLIGGQYKPLSEEQIRRIHEASLAVLEATGISVDNEEAQALFREAGARVDGNRVRISRAMVEEALDQAPSRVLLAGRDAAHDLLLEGKRIYAGTGGSPTQVLDPGAQTVRPGTLSDLADLVRLADALEHVDFVVIPLYPTDVPTVNVPINRFYTSLTNTTKHVMGGMDSVRGAEQVLKMGVRIAGSLEALRERPFISCIACWMISPLHLDDGVTDILVHWCRHGLPVVLSSAPMAGSSAPVTLAGTLVQLNAEQLSGIVLTQLIQPRTPVLAGYIPGVADLRTGGYLGGAVEFGMMQAAAAQMAQFYGVPIYCSGGMTDSKLPDQQAGYEKMVTLLLAAMGGCNYIHHAVGMITNMSCVSLEQTVIDDELVGIVKRVLRGINVTDETLATEAIERVGPGGNFLMDDHTVKFMRSEFFFPKIGNRRDRRVWEQEGKVDTRARAAARAERLLHEHQSPGLPPEVDATLRTEFPII